MRRLKSMRPDRYRFIDGERYFPAVGPNSVLRSSCGTLGWKEADSDFCEKNRYNLLGETEGVQADGTHFVEVLVSANAIDRYPIVSRQLEPPRRPSEFSAQPWWNQPQPLAPIVPLRHAAPTRPVHLRAA
jgi:hypothetical protein